MQSCSSPRSFTTPFPTQVGSWPGSCFSASSCSSGRSSGSRRRSARASPGIAVRPTHPRRTVPAIVPSDTLSRHAAQPSGREVCVCVCARRLGSDQTACHCCYAQLVRHRFGRGWGGRLGRGCHHDGGQRGQAAIRRWTTGTSVAGGSRVTASVNPLPPRISAPRLHFGVDGGEHVSFVKKYINS